MEFKYKLDDIVFSILDYCFCEHQVSSVSISKDSILYICNSIYAVKESDLFLTKDECKKALKALKDKIDKKLKDLDVL